MTHWSHCSRDADRQVCWTVRATFPNETPVYAKIAGAIDQPESTWRSPRALLSSMFWTTFAWSFWALSIASVWSGRLLGNNFICIWPEFLHTRLIKNTTSIICLEDKAHFGKTPWLVVSATKFNSQINTPKVQRELCPASIWHSIIQHMSWFLETKWLHTALQLLCSQYLVGTILCIIQQHCLHSSM